MSEAINEREQAILNLLLTQGSVNVSELSQILGVSDVTIRSDLSGLEEKGFLTRTHGGAVPATNAFVRQKKQAFIEEKNIIAKKAASLVQNGDTIMIEAGTTTGLLPRYLFGKKDIHIITNSAQVFSVAKGNPDLKITLTGGEYRRNTDSFVGALAQETLNKFYVDKAFVGTDGFSIESGITTHLVEGGEVIKVMKQRSNNLILMADSSKYGKIGVVSILPIKDIDMIITNKNLEEEKELHETGIKVLFCD